MTWSSQARSRSARISAIAFHTSGWNQYTTAASSPIHRVSASTRLTWASS
jgi:hypothetical protein